MLFFVALVGVFIIGVIVFGGGQLFMPLFKSLWEFLNSMGANISDQKIDSIFAIANATPGVIGTKLAVFTGYLVANGDWWGWLALILTYLIFTIPSIVIIVWSIKGIQKSKENIYLKNIVAFLRPTIIGILLALAIQLLFSTAFPQVAFNESNEYLGIVSNAKTTFFTGWRMYALISYSLVVIPESCYLYTKKVGLFTLILIHVAIGMVIFQPWS